MARGYDSSSVKLILTLDFRYKTFFSIRMSFLDIIMIAVVMFPCTVAFKSDY